MADEQAFDLEKLRELIALMDEHGLTEISLSQGDQSWKLRRGGACLLYTSDAADE